MNFSKKRAVILSLFLSFLFALLVAQFYSIQILDGEKWSKVASRQHYFVVIEPFVRGTFYSNASLKQKSAETPQRFVFDIPKSHLYIDPESIPEVYKDTIAKNLALKLSLKPKERLDFRENFYKKCRSRKIAMWLDKDTCDEITTWWYPFAKKRKIPRNAIYFVGDFQRSYPFGKLLGQTLQTVQNIRDEVTWQALPTGGLELYFNKYLQGKQGKRRLMRSPRNSLETGEVLTLPENGADIYLTINHCLQAIAEEEIAKAVTQFKAKSGTALMMDPKTGEILALAQAPFFYPPHYQEYFNDEKLIDQTRIKAICDAHEPGSVMKPITMALSLKANKVLKSLGKKAIFDPEEKMATSNCHFQGRKNLKDTHLHSFLNMDMALQKSSNIYVARLIDKVIQQLGCEWYKRELHETFGFGEKTGIELPSESFGLVPTPGKKHPNGKLEWSLPTPYSLAMGHNIQVSSLQLARAFALFANGGFLVKPTLVRKIVKKDREGKEVVLLDNTLLKEFPHVLDKDIVDRVVRALKFATKPGGTAPRADIYGYTEAGKTGTAQKIVNGLYSDTMYCSSFVGFVPVKDPAFVLVITMDEPFYGYIPGVGKNHHGGTCCTPAFREIGKRALEYLGIPPDDPTGFPVSDPRYNSDTADWKKETRELKEMYEKWNKR